MKQPKVLVTGANGFVGAALMRFLVGKTNINVIGAVRNSPEMSRGEKLNLINIGELTAQTNWTQALNGVDIVVHCAARVHVLKESSVDSLSAYRKTNVDGTLNLARQAVAQGVKRFIFISSIKVNGEFTKPGKPFTEEVGASPTDPYGLSKYEAERELIKLAEASAMEVVIIRPPLIYGPGVKANFLNMMQWLKKEIPLPFGAVHNFRSLVALDNLIDFIFMCMTHPSAANQVFLVSDGEDISTTNLLKILGCSLGASTKLIPVPAYWLMTIATFFGRRDVALRICGSLQVDITKAKTLLSWHPPVSTQDALNSTAISYMNSESKKI